MDIFLQSLSSPFLWGGVLITLKVFVAAAIGGLFFGTIVAVLRESRHRSVASTLWVFVWLVRGAPLLLQLLFLYDVLPQFGIRLSSVATAIIGLTIFEAAYMGEIIRGGLHAVEREQIIAGQALGLSQFKISRLIVAPQAMRAIIPPLGTTLIFLVKDTSLASVIALDDLLSRAETVASQNFRFLEVLSAALVMYLVMAAILSAAQQFGERYADFYRRRTPVSRPARTPNTVASQEVAQPTIAALLATAIVPPAKLQQPVVSCRGVVKRHGERTVLNGLDFDLDAGEVVVLIGPSGSGKSTMLRLINHLERFDAGTIEVHGAYVGYHRRNGQLVEDRNVAKARARANIGMVFQSYNLIRHLTALDNVCLGAVHARGQSRAAAADDARKLLRAVGLIEHADKRPHELSGGQQQRVAIARALATRPGLLLLDEPTSALDPELVGDVQLVLRQLAASGMTMLLATHDIAFARDVADRVLFMSDGSIVEEGPARAVLDAPSHPLTRRFLRLIAAPGTPQRHDVTQDALEAQPAETGRII